MKKKIKVGELTNHNVRIICQKYIGEEGCCSEECPFYRSRDRKGQKIQLFCLPSLKGIGYILTDEDREKEIEVEEELLTK